MLKLVFACAAVAVLGAVALAKLPHALRGQPISGEVVDAATGRSIPEVHVAFIWEAPVNPSGFTGHNSRTICYHAAATTTDASGRFRIAGWKKWSTYDVDPYGPIALVYARNYVPRQISLQHSLDEPDVERLGERYALEPFSGRSEERMHTLFWGLANQNCHYGGNSQKSLYPMFRSIYAEARAIAQGPDQRETANLIGLLAAKSALAPDPNGPGNDEQLKAFVSENLK